MNLNKEKKFKPAFMLLLLCLLFTVSGCAEKEEPFGPQQALRLLAEDQWPLIVDDMDEASLAQAAAYSLDYLSKRSLEQEFVFGPHKYTAKQLAAAWQRVLELRGQQPNAAAFTAALKSEFNLYQAAGQNHKDGQVLFTGYYEPVLEGRLQKEKGFEQPLYALPEDLFIIELQDFDPELPNRRLVGRGLNNRLKPYPAREQIDFEDAIKDSAQVLAWIADPVEAFFLHVQGSGQIKLADGSRIRLGYAAANGQPYRSIGNLLLQQQHMQSHEMSMQNIRAFLEKNPQLRRQVLSYNPSYVFFRLLPAEGGPHGAYGRPVTAGRSIACDRALFPPMALAFIKGTTPTAEGSGPLSRLVWAQDTGGAIKGPGRLDLFYGSDEQAGNLAGRMKHMGQMYFLAPKVTNDDT